MDWPSLTDIGTLTAVFLLGGGVVTAVIEGFFHRPKERALTEKERALAEKERILAEAAKTDSSIELVRLWMVSNDKLLESNHRLEKSNERIQKSNDRLRNEMNDTRRVLISLVNIVERIMPLLTQVADQNEIDKLNAMLIQARAFED